jgi:TetR/AcrR family acrAB operon transcriptional repressor
MARKTKEEAQATRTLLLDTAEHLFSTRGVASTSLHEIAEAAGLTRGAIYWHFENKGDLLTALWERVAEPLRRALDEEAGPDKVASPLERIRMKIGCKVRLITSIPRVRCIMTILMLRCEFAEDTESASTYFLREREYAFDCLRSDFIHAIETGELPRELDTERAVIGLFGLIDGLCFHWLINPERFSLTDTSDLAVASYISGLQRQFPGS